MHGQWLIFYLHAKSAQVLRTLKQRAGAKSICTLSGKLLFWQYPQEKKNVASPARCPVKILSCLPLNHYLHPSKEKSSSKEEIQSPFTLNCSGTTALERTTQAIAIPSQSATPLRLLFSLKNKAVRGVNKVAAVMPMQTKNKKLIQSHNHKNSMFRSPRLMACTEILLKQHKIPS